MLQLGDLADGKGKQRAPSIILCSVRSGRKVNLMMDDHESRTFGGGMKDTRAVVKARGQVLYCVHLAAGRPISATLTPDCPGIDDKTRPNVMQSC